MNKKPIIPFVLLFLSVFAIWRSQQSGNQKEPLSESLIEDVRRIEAAKESHSRERFRSDVLRDVPPAVEADKQYDTVVPDLVTAVESDDRQMMRVQLLKVIQLHKEEAAFRQLTTKLKTLNSAHRRTVESPLNLPAGDKDALEIASELNDENTELSRSRRETDEYVESLERKKTPLVYALLLLGSFLDRPKDRILPHDFTQDRLYGNHAIFMSLEPLAFPLLSEDLRGQDRGLRLLACKAVEAIGGVPKHIVDEIKILKDDHDLATSFQAKQAIEECRGY